MLKLLATAIAPPDVFPNDTGKNVLIGFPPRFDFVLYGMNAVSSSSSSSSSSSWTRTFFFLDGDLDGTTASSCSTSSADGISSTAGTTGVNSLAVFFFVTVTSTSGTIASSTIGVSSLYCGSSAWTDWSTWSIWSTWSFWAKAVSSGYASATDIVPSCCETPASKSSLTSVSIIFKLWLIYLIN